jgi:hypothetical protein
MTHRDECPAINNRTALRIERDAAVMACAFAALMNRIMQSER